MSVGALVGIALIALAAAASVWGTTALVRANFAERVARQSNACFERWVTVCSAGLAGDLFGCSLLQGAYGWQVCLVGFPVFALPPLVIAVVHNRRLARGAPAR